MSNTTTATDENPAREPDSSAASGPRDGAAAKTLGLARWVQIAFMVGALLLFWLLDKVATTLWGVWGEPDTNLVTALSIVVSGLTVWRLYRNERVHQGAFEVVGELVKVTWPARKETSSSTVVVIITSVIAAVLLGLMDAFWSSITDFIY